jgi:hypothetical protein
MLIDHKALQRGGLYSHHSTEKWLVSAMDSYRSRSSRRRPQQPLGRKPSKHSARYYKARCQVCTAWGQSGTLGTAQQSRWREHGR